MRIATPLATALLVALLAGCQQHPPANDQLDAVLWTQTSIEHDLLFRQVYANATRQLDKALADPGWDALAEAPRELAGLPPAVIVDIDETLLDNVPLNARTILEDRPYDYQEWNQWVERAEARALPGSVAFLQAAAQRGITPYYLTNREPGQEQATLVNLRRAGFPIDDTAQILTAGTAIGGCADAGSDKTCRRHWVGSRARVLMLVGDSFGDFIAGKGSLADQQRVAAPYLGWLGERLFLLPNPTYGHWYSAPYQGREDLPASEKRALKQRALQPQYPTY
ncbi:5'-nucleotidase, lipoprotein e(P4) family [Pseudomonas tohonis]|uniref:5'-nucleotidase, lipoprotein e(P4) family n=1 Tax=Pseudomonas tohonis TaxID=2725477 RepID=A0A6J4E6R2_9PSED|nr:HAD family acid phosphatase [Pseudomonas tohonis]BCG24614.1 5'-nucleotidase, lipoprotein e(P4) family [Pseudomonas tohonis]GJN52027.1 5'-nucleotidase, lipoprotein e(P4) family [Pseudomonas tohonis]